MYVCSFLHHFIISIIIIIVGHMHTYNNKHDMDELTQHTFLLFTVWNTCALDTKSVFSLFRNGVISYGAGAALLYPKCFAAAVSQPREFFEKTVLVHFGEQQQQATTAAEQSSFPSLLSSSSQLTPVEEQTEEGIVTNNAEQQQQQE